ncbi:TMEM175 family protein [Rhodopseudomonas palustris]|uniref:TMEM175 family protein n=1 Tax=Rhodopseudomonas palustris TaxID=1076 RepID=UPI002ACD835C|nr:TMEM175 family protein [Rhodopseudomonas palustris]WQH00916.1 TMEM175 family protein [Rhodopseudomonas palustris]
MSGGHLEMRRMEALSNTVFGVAMTLLAYQAPREKFASADPQWREIWHLYGAFLSTLLLSFIVAGMFWYSHQRRLAYATHAGRAEVLLNLFFLLSIILLPVTCGLYGNNYDSPNVTTLYSFNLLLIALFNTVLWAIAVARKNDWATLATPAFALVLFCAALVACLIDPHSPKYIWPIAFLSPFISAYVERRHRPNFDGEAP